MPPPLAYVTSMLPSNATSEPDWESLAEKIRAVWDRDDLIHAWSDDSTAIPLQMIATPPDAEHVRLAVRAAHEHNAPVYSLGGCTSLDYGFPARTPGLGLDLSRLNQVVDYPARDMTITVGAGLSVGRLSEMLAGEKQRLPVDIPEDDRATLGGAIATNASGPRRFACGTLRDYVIGIRAVDGEGTPFKAGGRVVKNVAGYDLCKLMVGSLGTLGVITEVTLKLRPRPETSVLIGVPVSGQGEQLARLLADLLSSGTQPMAIEVLNGAAARAIGESLGSPAWFLDVPRGDRLLVVGFEGTAAEVHWQREQLRAEWHSEGLALWEREADDADPLWQALTDFPTEVAGGRAGERASGRVGEMGTATRDAHIPQTQNAESQTLDPTLLTFKANLRSSHVPEFFGSCDDLPIQLASHAGNGIVTGHLDGVADVQVAVRHLAELRRRAAQAGGSLVVLRCPRDWKAEIPVWGEPRADWPLMERVRRKLDPQGILNPGRFINGA